jgi:hypothetical protein
MFNGNVILHTLSLLFYSNNNNNIRNEIMTESSVRPRQHEEEGNDKKKNHGALSSSPESLVTTTGHAILSCSEQLKRCDTTDTDQEESCAYSTRAVWHFNTNNNVQQQPSKQQQHDVFQTRNRRYHHPRLAILGVTVTTLCAVITGVALVILIPRRSSRHSHHARTNSSNVVGGNNHNHNNNNGTSTNSNGSINATTTNHSNDESNATRPNRPNNTTTNETTDDDMLLTDDCASIETADAAWNAIGHYNNNTNNDDMQQDTLNATVSLLVVLGPMVGHVTETTAKIWAFVSNRDSHNNMSILYQRLGNNNNNGGNDCPSPKVQVTNISYNNQTTMELADLEPDTRYRFHVLVNDTKIGKMGTFATLPAEITKFRYVFGSCISFKRDANQTIWNHVLQQEPAFLILNGDTVYSDTMNYSKHWEYHSKQRQIPTFANIIRQVPVYASWDDHDYGPNDSDGLNSDKEQSLQAFTDLFPNPSFGTPAHPGIYSTFSYGNHVRKRERENERAMPCKNLLLCVFLTNMSCCDSFFFGGCCRFNSTLSIIVITE